MSLFRSLHPPTISFDSLLSQSSSTVSYLGVRSGVTENNPLETPSGQSHLTPTTYGRVPHFLPFLTLFVVRSPRERFRRGGSTVSGTQVLFLCYSGPCVPSSGRQFGELRKSQKVGRCDQSFTRRLFRPTEGRRRRWRNSQRVSISEDITRKFRGD